MRQAAIKPIEAPDFEAIAIEKKREGPKQSRPNPRRQIVIYIYIKKVNILI
jgi:hypothetical protein